MRISDMILVIDDSLLICEIVKDTLKDSSAHIMTAQNGKEGIALAWERIPNLILLDIVLPDSDGFEICRRLKAEPRTAGIPIIFITSKTDSNTIIECFQNGAVDYIAKPFVPSELHARVAVHLENQRTRQELNHIIKEMSRLLNHDELTKLYNRRFFSNKMRHYMKVNEGAMCIALGDVDDFKKINDTFGHVAGDRVLAAAAAVMRETCRKEDIIARWGGEEFILFMPQTAIDEAAQIVELIRKNVERAKIEYPGGTIQVKITFGVVQISTDRTIEKNISLADQALYEGKKKGENCCVIYHEPSE